MNNLSSFRWLLQLDSEGTIFYSTGPKWIPCPSDVKKLKPSFFSKWMLYLVSFFCRALHNLSGIIVYSIWLNKFPAQLWETILGGRWILFMLFFWLLFLLFGQWSNLLETNFCNSCCPRFWRLVWPLETKCLVNPKVRSACMQRQGGSVTCCSYWNEHLIWLQDLM